MGETPTSPVHPFTLHPITPATLFAVIVLSISGGCAPYIHVQTDLIDQSRKGVAMISQSLAAQQKSIEQFQHLQRRRLDEAFDTDVREQSSLEAEWVIDHRRAYAMAIDALNDSQQQQQVSRRNDEATLAAIDLALQKLEWLISIPLTSKGK